MRVCKDCGANENTVPWVTKHGIPNGRLCLSCTAARRKAYIAEDPTRRALAYEATSKWILNNLEYRRDTCKEYYHRPEVKARVLQARRMVTEQTRSVWRERCREWGLHNGAYKLAATRKYMLNKIKRTPRWLNSEDYKQIESVYNLAKIMTECTGASYHVDHIIPLQGRLVSGLHVPHNLQVVPAVQNLSKGNKYGISEEETCSNTA